MHKSQRYSAMACMAWIGLCLAPHHAAAEQGRPGCHTVRFDMVFEPVEPPVFAATFSGDLEGTAEILLLSATDPTGITNTATFHVLWNITGGKVDDLIGSGFETIIDNRNVPNQSFDPANPFDEPLGYAIGKHRAENGVRRANLTYIGEARLTPDFSFQSLLSHRGVICLH